MGVLLFFVHTSYVLMHSLERLWASSIRKGYVFLTFYIRRIFRIYPLSMVTVSVLTIIGFPYTLPVARMFKVFVSNFFLVENLTGQPHVTAVLWTLPIELQMYLVLPLCFLVARRSIKAVIGLLGLAAIMGWWVIPIGGEHYEVFLFAPCFIAGVLAYAIYVHRKDIVEKFSGKYWAPILFATVFVVGLIFRPDAYRSVMYGWATTIPLAFLIPFFKDMKDSWLSRASHQVAKYSFGIYLLHIPAIDLAHDNWLGAILLTAFFSVVAYHLIEAPFIRLGLSIPSFPNYKTSDSISLS